MLKHFFLRLVQPPEPSGEADDPAGEPTPPKEPATAEDLSASGPDDGPQPPDVQVPVLALDLHKASDLTALVDAATDAAARQFEGTPLLVLLKGPKEDLTLARGASEPVEKLHGLIADAFEQESLHSKPLISASEAEALFEGPAVKRVPSLADLFGEALGDKACWQAQTSLKIQEVVSARLDDLKEPQGVALYLLQGPQTDIDSLKALADHIAVALARLRELNEARRFGTIDPIRWVLDQERFLDELNREVSRAARHAGRLAVLFLVIDNLEKLRAEFGPSQANRLLRAIGATISRELRASDTLAAYREDGFALILPETDNEGAAILADRLMGLASGVNIFGTEEPAPKVECGVAAAAFPEDGKSAVELGAAAESRLLGLDWPLLKTGTD